MLLNHSVCWDFRSSFPFKVFNCGFFKKRISRGKSAKLCVFRKIEKESGVGKMFGIGERGVKVGSKLSCQDIVREKKRKKMKGKVMFSFLENSEVQFLVYKKIYR